jgi:hypothetical protein
MMKLTLLAASALALVAVSSQTVSAATVTCEMPISQGTGGALYDSFGGHRRFEYCTADGFTGEANVLRFEQNVTIGGTQNPDGSQLWLTVKKESGAGSAHLYILNGSLGAIVPSTSAGSCEMHDPLDTAPQDSTGTTTIPCTTNTNVANIHMELLVDH